MILKKENIDMPYKESDKAESERYAFCKETIQLFVQTQLGYLALAERLYTIKVNKLYLPYWENFYSYCNEISDMSASVVSRLLKIHKKVVIDGEIPTEEVSEAGWSKVALTLPFIVDKESARHWVDMAKAKTRKDLEEDVKELKTGKSMITCEHKRHYTVKICHDCGFKWRDYAKDDTNEESV